MSLNLIHLLHDTKNKMKLIVVHVTNFFKQERVFLEGMFVLALMLFFPMFKQFFSADDWFHLRISHISSVSEFVNFFRFDSTPQRASFYRPLPTQVFFFLLSTLFGLSALPYYVVVFAFFLLSIFLVFLFAKEIGEQVGNNLKIKNKIVIPYAVTFLYTISQTHFTSLYFLSAFQEIMLVVCVLAVLIFWLRSHYVLTVLFFVLALTCKETAVVTPAVFLLLLLCQKEKTISRKRAAAFLSIAFITLIYLWLRFHVFGLSAVADPSYALHFSPSQVFATLRFYTLWSIGAPETLINYMFSFWRVLPKYFADFQVLAWPSLIALIICLCLLVTSTVVTVRKLIQKKQNLWLTFLGGSFFLLYLLPVLFFPDHRFALELGLPIVGFSVLITSLIDNLSHRWQVMILLAFFSLNFISILMTVRTHYSVVRSQTSWRVIQYFDQLPALDRQKDYFVFINDTPDYGKAWGSSKQVEQALHGTDAYEVAFPNNPPRVFYDDSSYTPPQNMVKQEISTKQMLGN